MASKVLQKTEPQFTRFEKVCLDVLKLTLVDLLKNEIHPTNLYHSIEQHSSLLHGQNKLDINQLKMCVLQPPEIPDYNEFDVTLLYKLIQNLCPSLAPTNGWGKDPVDADIQIGDDIERLRSFRNIDVHEHLSEIPDSDFQIFWKKLKSVFHRIQRYMISIGYNVNYEKQVDELKELDIGIELIDNHGIAYVRLNEAIEKEVPMVSINGPEKVLCGDTAQFNAVISPDHLKDYSLTWQKVAGRAHFQIDTKTEKYTGSTDQRLFIHSVCEDDKGEYQAFLSRDMNREQIIAVSNVIFLQAIAGTQGKKDACIPVHSLILKGLFNSIDSDLQVKHSTTSFANDILHVLKIDKIRSEVKSLSQEIVLNTIPNATLYDNKQGKVYVAEVTVVCEKNKLVVKKKDIKQWMDFLGINKDNIIRIILIHSRYLRVIEAKHSVYREFQSEIDSGKIYLQHVIEDCDEIAKISAWKKLSRLTDMVELIIDRFQFEKLSEMLSEAANLVFNNENITRLCLSVQINDDIKQARSADDTKQIRTMLVKDTMQKIGELLGCKLFSIVLQSCFISEEERIGLHFDSRTPDLLSSSLITTIVSTFNLLFSSWASFPATEVTCTLCGVNCIKWRREIAREIYDLVCESKETILLRLFEQIKPMSETTLLELKSLSERLRKIENQLQIIDLNEVVKTWEQREMIQSINGPDKHPSVLKVIAGCKDNKPTVKVFLNHNDEDAMKIFNDSDQIPKGTHFEFVNLAVLSTEIFRGKEKIDHSSVNKSVRECLGQIIKNQGEKMYSNYSTIVGLGIGTMDSNGSIQPCIIIYCLDKHLVPYGEKELPKSIEGWNCDTREDYVIFGSCFDCRIITNPNPGCCIGLHEPPNGSGSVGFLVKENDSTPERAGFLTAAHVAADNWRDLYYSNSLLSTLDGLPFEYRIVHPLPPTQNVSRVIGRVKELFCGNWGPEGTGIDAAFVENDEPRRGDIKKVEIADGRNLRFDRSIKVFKRGGTTGETEGYLSDNSLSVCLDFTNGFIYFDRCYAVTSINSPFFEPGDSGSGVFLIENGVPTKPLGIAFAFHKTSQTTAVCRIDKIIDAFNLSVYQYEEESMEA